MNDYLVALCTLQETKWAIGTTIGGTDIQDYTSVGRNNYGINDELFGFLLDKETYYVSLKVKNGAGLESTFNITNGKLD